MTASFTANSSWYQTFNMPGVMTAKALDKVNHYGIEVLDGITWQGWEPGREYTKNLVLKNVKVKTQKLKYKLV